MKKTVGLALCVILTFGLFTALVACNGVPREELLKLYMPGEYIDDDVVESFSEWYMEKTGKKMTAKVDVFDAVEDVQLAIESKADYDLVCPSDYMVGYLLSKGYLQKIDKSIVDIGQEELFKSQYVETSKQFDPTLEYSIPYMYGTLGIAYDYTKTNKHITSWEALFGSEYANHRSVKKSIHDAYAAACMYNERNNLVGLVGSAQKEAVQRIFYDTSKDTIDKASATLGEALKSAVWDVDNVKFEMAANDSDVAVALMWSCDAGYVMNDYEDEDGKIQKGNRNLWYTVPEEGGNVYIDCFCISNYAKNVEAANYFLQYLCEKDVAIANSEWSGAISPVAAAYDELYKNYVEDEDGMFEGVGEEWKNMFLEMMFPSEQTLNRCGVMRDFGTDKDALNRMWAKLL